MEEVGENRKGKAQTKDIAVYGMEPNAYRHASSGPSTYAKVREGDLIPEAHYI